MAAFAGFHLPDITDNKLKDERERKQILEYLFQLTEQLQYVMTHLDADNMTDAFKKEIKSGVDTSAFERMIADTEGRMSTLSKQTASGFEQVAKKTEELTLAAEQSAKNDEEIRKALAKVGEDAGGNAAEIQSIRTELESYQTQTAEGFEQVARQTTEIESLVNELDSETGDALDAAAEDRNKIRIDMESYQSQTAAGFEQTVKKNEVVSSINQSAEDVRVQAGKILLEGYVSINGAFTVDDEGYLRCSGGTLGAFTVTKDGAIMGNGSMMIGNMTFDGNAVLGLERAKSLLITPDNIDFDKGTVFEEGASYLLGIVPGSWPNYSTDFAVGTPYVDIDGTRYYIGLEPIGGSGSNTNPDKVTAIRIIADNLNMRASNSASSDSLGYAQSGELYQGSISGEWAYCTHELVYTSGGYTRIPLERSFYCATQSSGGKKYVEQITVQLA